MEIPTSTIPPLPMNHDIPADLCDTWRRSEIPPRIKPAFPEVDQRATPRTRVYGELEFTIGDGVRHTGICRNLSLGGAAIQTTEPAPFGCRVVVFMQLVDVEGETAIGGTV